MNASFTGPDSGHRHPHSPDHSHEVCEEFTRAEGVSRRRVLQGLVGAGALGVAHATFGGVFRQAVFGAETDNNVVVVLSLRGGVDGMSVVVPYGDPAYLGLRGSIAVPEGSLLQKDTLFGLHPDLAPLEQQWIDGRMAAVHATGLRVPNRSHFSAMEEVEDADPGSDIRRGWINRAIGLDTDAFPAEAVQFGTSIVPTSLTGPAPVIAAQSMRSSSSPGRTRNGTMRRGRAAGVRSSRRSGRTPSAPSASRRGTPCRRWTSSRRTPGRRTPRTTERSIRPTGARATSLRRWRTRRS